MNRRRFLVMGTTAVAGLTAGGIAYRRATLAPPSLAVLLSDLNALQNHALTTRGAWSPYMVLTHLAQSVEFTMTGFPRLKSVTFRRTAGRAALFAFSTAGAMRHNLAEPIPGAPALIETGSTADAIDRLRDSLRRLEAFDSPLPPHFAFGHLSKDQAIAAQIFHVRNHLDDIRLA